MKKSKYRVRINEMLDDDLLVGDDGSTEPANDLHKIRRQAGKWQRRDDRVMRCAMQKFRMGAAAAHDEEVMPQKRCKQ